MAKKKPENKSALAADDGAVIPRVSLGEVGFTALRVSNGHIYEELNPAFQFPRFFRTINEMRNTAIIASALNAYKMLLSRVKWHVEAPVGASDQETQRAKIIESMMTDMENTWDDFIADVIEYLPYGYSVQEKVFRRRLRKNGSRYNDGIIGLKKIAPRPQESIARWEFSEDGRDLLAVYQGISSLQNSYLYLSAADKNGLIRIPREKFLLFSADATRGNPMGHSILKGVYLSWKQMSMLKDTEILGIAKEATGIPLIRIPAAFMSEDADDGQKAVYESAKQIGTNIKNGTADCIVFPTFIDPESKKDMFDISLMEKKGMNGANIDTVIRRYQDEILSALAVDILKAGTNPGSFSLSDGDTNVLALAMSHRLNEIASVLNSDLIPSIYKLNGWTDEVMPKFVPSDISSVSLEELSKFLQRTASTGLIERDREIMNIVRKAAGARPRPDDEPVDEKALTTNTSNSGEGMAPGTTGDGTSKIGGKSSGQDRSANNNDNKG
jgi:hypothetical protein